MLSSPIIISISTIFFTKIKQETLIVNFKPKAIPVEIDNTINPKPVTDNATEVKIVARKTKVSSSFYLLDKISLFRFSFLIPDFHLGSRQSFPKEKY